jgi:hypothetical protein
VNITGSPETCATHDDDIPWHRPFSCVVKTYIPVVRPAIARARLLSIARKLLGSPADKSNIHATLQLTFAPSIHKMHNVIAMLELGWS